MWRLISLFKSSTCRLLSNLYKVEHDVTTSNRILMTGRRVLANLQKHTSFNLALYEMISLRYDNIYNIYIIYILYSTLHYYVRKIILQYIMYVCVCVCVYMLLCVLSIFFLCFFLLIPPLLYEFATTFSLYRFFFLIIRAIIPKIYN